MFAQAVGRLSHDEMLMLSVLAHEVRWKSYPDRAYRTAEVTEFWEPCQRSFFVLLPPKCSITRHTDSVPGITHHLVLQTNPGCLNWWMEDGQEKNCHMEQGARYIVQRDPVHWATNYGDTDRIHLLVEYG